MDIEIWTFIPIFITLIHRGYRDMDVIPIFITLIHRGYRDMDVIHSRKIMRKFRIQDSLIVLYAGRHLDSLRQLRLNREGRPDAGALAPTRERFSVFEHATQPEQVERETHLIK